MFRQNQITIVIIAFGIVFLSAGWLYRAELGITSTWLFVVTLSGLGIVYHRVALARSRRFIRERRRYYKTLWRRPMNEDNTVDLALSEEQMVVLLGRIRSQGATVYAMSAICVGALYFDVATLAYVMVIGLFFLPVRLHLLVRSLVLSIPSDLDNLDLTNYFAHLVDSGADYFLLQLDLARIHDFILPTHALPFWRLDDTVVWLGAMGLQQTLGGNWRCSAHLLKLFEYEEVIRIESC